MICSFCLGVAARTGFLAGLSKNFVNGRLSKQGNKLAINWATFLYYFDHQTVILTALHIKGTTTKGVWKERG